MTTPPGGGSGKGNAFEGLPSPLEAVDDLRAAAKWTLAAEGAVGAALISGGPLVGAAVPPAPVDKHGDLRPGEDHVGGVPDGGQGTRVDAVRAEKVVHGSDQRDCSLGRPAEMITDHVPAVRVPPNHTGHSVAAAVPA